jgi:hypothetical protein
MKQASKCFSLSLYSICFNFRGFEIGSGIALRTLATRCFNRFCLQREADVCLHQVDRKPAWTQKSFALLFTRYFIRSRLQGETNVFLRQFDHLRGRSGAQRRLTLSPTTFFFQETAGSETNIHTNSQRRLCL